MKKETRKRRPPFPIIKFFISNSSENRERGVARWAGQHLVQRATSVPREGQIWWPSREWWKGVLFCFSIIHLFLAVLGFSLVTMSRGCSLVRRAGISSWWPLSLQSMALGPGGFHVCGTGAQVLPGIWKVPEPGLEPVSPALAGGFFSTGPPGKSRCTV